MKNGQYSNESGQILLDVFKYIISTRNEGFDLLIEFNIIEKIKEVFRIERFD